MPEPYRIMVVDDEPIVREAIATQKSWVDHQIEVVATCANAIEALAYLEEHDVDLMLVDIRMPVMDGLSFVQKVREKKSGIPFIIISGYADFEYARQAMRFGAVDYLLKPLSEASLLMTVRKQKDKWEQAQLAKKMQNIGMHVEVPQDETHVYSPTVSQLLALVDEEIANEALTLKWISQERMYLNETYLSKLFQREVGQKFSAYLLEQRMQLAMRLMLQEDLQIQEVARRTGFGENAPYFSIVFRKYTTMTPSEFRKKLAGTLP